MHIDRRNEYFDIVLILFAILSMSVYISLNIFESFWEQSLLPLWLILGHPRTSPSHWWDKILTFWPVYWLLRDCPLLHSSILTYVENKCQRSLKTYILVQQNLYLTLPSWHADGLVYSASTKAGAIWSLERTLL